LNTDTNELLQAALQATRAACREIMQIYHQSHVAHQEKADQSPLTLADTNAHHVIMQWLQPTGIPVISEEGKNIPYETRRQWHRIWLVDPLDGTREFIQRNGEFTVNIALISRQQPVMGIVAVPAADEIYYGGPDLGAFVMRAGNIRPLPVRRSVSLAAPQLRVVASRSHLDEQTAKFIETLQQPQLVTRGSSLKFMMLAEGTADVYPRYAPTMEWDTAAAHAIVNAVGLKVYQANTLNELMYNKQSLVNPAFVCY